MPEHGPPELMRLARGFNAMTRRLAAVAAQNRRLNERLLTLQAEERADLARDLHDEIGPLLFAVDMTAATIERLAANRPRAANSGAGARDPGRGRPDAASCAVLLGRLRPIQATGLERRDRAAGGVLARPPSRDRRSSSTVSVDEDRIGDDLRETIYRVVQEGMSNAVRHGKPTRVEIAVAPDDADGIRVEVADDGIGMAATARPGATPSTWPDRHARTRDGDGRLTVDPARPRTARG